MFYKYLMSSNKDIRGVVKLIVRTTDGTEVAYTSTFTPDPQMVPLVDEEIKLVKGKTDLNWNDQRKELVTQVDQYADEMRELVLDMGVNTIYYEYNQVDAAMSIWEAAGSDPENIPMEIQSWLDASDQTLEWVIVNIKTATATYKGFIAEVRRIRLMGKKALETCSNEDIESEYDRILYSLDWLVAYALNNS
jgi:hypothetical protein